MHHYGGTQKITFGSPGGPDSDYQSKLAAAQSHAAYLDMGVGVGMEMAAASGVGDTYMKPEQSPVYGNVNATEGDLSQGAGSNFSAKSDNFNAPLSNPERETGSLDYATSSTRDPQTDPQDLDQSALAQRIQMMAANGSLNLNPSSVFSI